MTFSNKKLCLPPFPIKNIFPLRKSHLKHLKIPLNHKINEKRKQKNTYQKRIKKNAIKRKRKEQKSVSFCAPQNIKSFIMLNVHKFHREKVKFICYPLKAFSCLNTFKSQKKQFSSLCNHSTINYDEKFFFWKICQENS